MTTKKIYGFALVAFIASIVGIIISLLLMKEDVISTAHTVFEYFPIKYGVTPASTWEGAKILGYFTTVLQIVTASIALSKEFSTKNRVFAAIMFVVSCAFDNYTDVIFRSGYLTGDLKVAMVSTFAFYTGGSEALQGLSWLVFFSMWRQAISDFMWGMARLLSGLASIGGEWQKFRRAAERKEERDRSESGGSVSASNPVGSRTHTVGTGGHVNSNATGKSTKGRGGNFFSTSPSSEKKQSSGQGQSSQVKTPKDYDAIESYREMVMNRQTAGSPGFVLPDEEIE